MTDEEVALLLSVGGRLRYSRAEAGEIWDFGWLPPPEYEPEVVSAVAVAADALVPFAPQGMTRAAEKALLYEAWRDPRVVAATGGKVFSGVHQITGSCVGAGGGNCVFTLSAVEVVRLSEPEQALVPFWLLPYGRSRYHSGIRGRGDGSSGAGFAKAMLEDGVVEASASGLPPYTDSDGLTWGGAAEMAWSDGARTPQEWLDRGRKHLVKSVARIRSADEAREGLVRGFPVTFCGMWGGLMRCPTAGDPPVLLNRRSGSWAHQQSCLGWWDHPSLGEIFWIQNQWGSDAHGRDPAGGPPGGYWIRKGDMDHQCRTGECFVWSQFDGFDAPGWEIPWVV